LKALAILKIQVHHDCGKELADNRRFTLATTSKLTSATRKPVAARVQIEEGLVLAAHSGHRATASAGPFRAK
jgi:hypothetical protein